MLKSMQEKRVILFISYFFLSLIMTGCASTTQVSETDEKSMEVATTETDPYEGFNRSMYSFNDGLDEYVAEPISDAYMWITPQFVQTGIANFFNNLKDINVVLNDFMQGKFQQSLEDTGRFTVNSTIGLVGLFDVATELGLEKHDEDFAQTLAVWGVPQGPYLVLPVLGPTTSRGIPGSVFDTAANPASYVGLPVQMLQMLNARANAEGSLNFIDEAALDPYVFTRESFLQYRKNLISDGKSEINDDLIDIEDELDEDDFSEDSQRFDNKDVTQVVAAEAKRQAVQVDASMHEDKGFGQASDSFESAVKSFDAAADSFQKANDKLNQLERY